MQKRDGGGFFPLPSNNPTSISLAYKSEPEGRRRRHRYLRTSLSLGKTSRSVVSITDAPRLALLPAPNATSLALKSESQLVAVVAAAVAAAHPSSLVTPSRRSELPAWGYTQLRLAPSSFVGTGWDRSWL
ncbi:hypothetical protein CVT26_009371 [Gymnopilus dilepis]|uniref:Uncharacterized protein n=1 Tax=Gymnopilus dilepis TaxID=231916 RepID=A0A409YID4_9AGAR|nr:hypothetical protein CVT26_009371 [Gymnopilus dilepis]